MASNHYYHEVGSDSDLTLLDAEKNSEDDHMENVRSHKPRPNSAKVISLIRSNWRLIEFSLLTTIILLLAAIYKDMPRQAQIGGDITHFAPICEQV